MWILSRYPNCRVSSVSNSLTQTTFIREEGRRRGFTPRLNVVHADANTFMPPVQYDRVVSIEMFEVCDLFQCMTCSMLCPK